MSFLIDPHGNPLLPSTGLRPIVSAEVKANMRQFLIDTLHDRVAHAEVVAAGRFEFRGAFTKALGAFFGNHRGQCDHLADVNFTFLEVTWRERYPKVSAREFLNAVHVPSPVSEKDWQKEVDESWELEIAGSEAAMQQHYEGSARVRKGSWLGSKSH